MKLELKHLAPYLPYRLKGNAIALDWDIEELNQELFRIETGRTKKNPNNKEPFLIVGDSEIELNGFTPILKPLSDLTEKTVIFIDYDVFIPPKNYEDCLCHSYEIIQRLFKHHYDVFGLIENDLAIDINTLK